ncbi:MAG: penicillin-binding protein 2 [Proteobacteria bacterium]|nr:penicillin-binding protein 2 [Pseudomonadota bacterium]
MVRIPLRPLAQILYFRGKGLDPDIVERHNISKRHSSIEDQNWQRSESRLFFMGLLFLIGFSLICVRMTVLASSQTAEPFSEFSSVKAITQRSNIIDRNGNILATNLFTNALYANPKIILQPNRAVKELVRIFPELSESRLLTELTSDKSFLWLKKKISPEQQQAVHDIGEPGLLFGHRELRVYPNGSLASHILGGAGFNNESAVGADIVGRAGVEASFDQFLRDPSRHGEPLQLSIDLSIQAATERVLAGGMDLLGAKGASSIVMDVKTGEVISMVSLPNFDLNRRPGVLKSGDPSNSPLFNRAVQGVYELGSTFKTFTAAKALDLELVNPETVIDFERKMIISGVTVRDEHYAGPSLTVADIISKSSNVGTAILASKVGIENQKSFLESLGLFHPTTLEMTEARNIKPLIPAKWTDMSMITISYGYGLSVSPLHLAVAYSSLVNGGNKVEPTILKKTTESLGSRVISETTSHQIRKILRSVVRDGTATLGEVEGYSVGGKTGTAEKQKIGAAGYDDDRVVSTFASFFPSNDPRYVLVVSFDEPSYRIEKESKRTAGWTAAPVAAEIIRRIAPLLNLWPTPEDNETVQLK